jgi:exopolyphosphatase/guanosine-5'-triphosphate,3'-diphosphate pyrophosphatase
MRIAVLDVGSNTVHLLVVDARRGARPLPAFSHKVTLRLAEFLDADGALESEGVEQLITFVREALQLSEDKGCESVLAFATSAIRESSNGEQVIEQVNRETGIDLVTLPGGAEASLTFLAVRRWFGWSSGRLAVFDIGGGSLEIAAGGDEAPDVARSLPLGAARLAARWFHDGPPDEEGMRRLRRQIRADIAHHAGSVLRPGRPDHAVATSKTFRSLARICGAAPSGEGPLVERVLEGDELSEWLPKLTTMSREALADLPGVSPSRTHQIVPGALVAEAVLDIFDLDQLEICPWALREGVILERIDRISRSG